MNSHLRFSLSIAAAIPNWKTGGIRGLWVKIDIKQAQVASVCAKVSTGRSKGGAQWLCGRVLDLRWRGP